MPDGPDTNQDAHAAPQRYELRIPDLCGEDWERWYIAMSRLGTHRRLGAAEKWVYGWLLLESRVRAVEGLEIYWPDLVAFTARSKQAVQETLKSLAKKRLVIVRSMTAAGRATVDVELPWSELESPAKDPQLRFDFAREASPGKSFSDADRSARKTMPENHAGKPCGFSGRKTKLPIPEEFLERVGRSELSMGQAIRAIAPGQTPRPERLPGTERNENCDIDIKNIKKSDIDIRKDQKYWEEEIHKALGDPRLEQHVAIKVAAALEARRIAWPTVAKICETARKIQRTQSKPAFVYFVGAMPQVFAEAGLPWKQGELAKTLAGRHTMRRITT